MGRCAGERGGLGRRKIVGIRFILFSISSCRIGLSRRKTTCLRSVPEDGYVRLWLVTELGSSGTNQSRPDQKLLMGSDIVKVPLIATTRTWETDDVCLGSLPGRQAFPKTWPAWPFSNSNKVVFQGIGLCPR